jgi:tetratricopeptide (TPR) repeat protein
MSTLRADLLEQAIGAARAGQHPTARGLLQAILADNPDDAQAWLWLSGVVDEPAEQVAALERVLALDPSNARASWGLQWMREHHPEVWLPPSPPVPPPSVRAEPEPADPALVLPEGETGAEGTGSAALEEPAPALADDATERLPVSPVELTPSPIDEEARCPFCGAPATVDELECPGCHRSLVVPEERGRGARIARLLLAIMSLLVTVVAIGGSIWLLQAAQQIPVTNILPAFLSTWAYRLSQAFAVEVVSALGLSLLGLALLSLVATLGMLRRWRWVYVLDFTLVVAAVAGLIVLIIAGLNLIPGVLALPVLLSLDEMFVFTGVMAGALVLILFRLGLLLGARREFFPRRGRVWLPMQTLSGAEHARLGMRYRDRGWYWAAARELERAAAEEPGKLKYRRLLADAYAQLGDQARARDELRASVNLDPDTSPLARSGGLAKDVQRERQ